jgi:pimeloyl-ACP methyl ester carboxylesterase
MLAKGGKLAMPVLALGGEKSFGTAQADTLRFVATNVTMGIIPGSGHWIMDENPKATTALIVNFLAK